MRAEKRSIFSLNYFKCNLLNLKDTVQNKYKEDLNDMENEVHDTDRFLELAKMTLEVKIRNKVYLLKHNVLFRH